MRSAGAGEGKRRCRFQRLDRRDGPKDAAPGTIRRDFASSKGENIVHGSDSPENGKLEIAFFFSEKELIQNG